MNWWPYVVLLIVLVGLMAFSVRNRRRQMAEQMVRAERIGVGTEVMTTSGLYGTVVARNADDTVMLSVAPGVEVRWAVAALRDAASLSDAYRRAMPATAEDTDESGDRDERAEDRGIDLDVDGKTYDDAGREVQLRKHDHGHGDEPAERRRDDQAGS